MNPHRPTRAPRMRSWIALLALAGVASTLVLVAVPLAAQSVVASAAAAETGLSVISTTTNQGHHLLGTDTTTPALGWVLDAPGRGAVQTAYQIRVATSQDTTADVVWDSDQVQSDRSTGVAYDGPALQEQTRYYWQVRVWDGAGQPSEWSDVDWWETGLLETEDWSGAEWIGGQDDAAASPWSLGTTAEGSSTVGVGDGRTYDASNAIDGDTATFWNDATPGDYPDTLTVTSPTAVELPGVTVYSHTDGVVTDYTVETWDGSGWVQQAAVAGSSDLQRQVSFGSTVTTTKVRVTVTGSQSQNGSYTRIAEVQPGLVDLESDSEVEPAPMLRREFDVDKTVTSGRAYVSGVGYYEMTLDGERVGDRVLDPGQSVYDKTVFYTTYDVTEQVSAQGAHALGVTLGRGFYGLPAEDTKYWNSAPWLGEPRLLLKLEIDYADGSSTTVVSDDSWTTAASPTVRDSVYAGETYDSRREQDGWDTAGFDDGAWRPANPMEAPTDHVQADMSSPSRVADTLVATSISQPADDVYVFAFPENTAGWARLRVAGTVGTEVTLTYGEKLRADGTVDDDGDSGLTNGAVQNDHYVLAGDGEETWEPRFSYKGFQYVQVEGYPGVPTKDDVVAQVVHNDVEATGSFDSSDGLLDTIHDMTGRTILNNLHSVMTDTPLYEKRGWLGDVNAILETTTDNFDLDSFYRTWMTSIVDNQGADGAGAELSPNPSTAGYTDPIWAGAIVTIPWELYQTYDDRSALEQYYGSMTAYVDYLTSQATGNLQAGTYGDWVSPETSAWPYAPEGARLVASAYYYRYADQLAQAAEVLGESADAARYADLAADIKTAFNNAFYDADEGVYHTEKSVGYRQTSNAVPLEVGLVPDDQVSRVAANLAADVESRGNHLNTGATGTRALLSALSDNGYVDTAYAVASSTTYPSWGYWIKNGATTLWEAWETDTRSKNHAFLGSVDHWFYSGLAGLQRGEAGWASALIEPSFPTGLDHAEASMDTIRGTVATGWSRADGGTIRLTAQVPANTTARIVLPADSAWSVSEGGHLLDDVDGVQDVSVDEATVTVTVGSGDYEFGFDPNQEGIGSALDLVSSLREKVADLAASGDLTADQADQLDEQLAGIEDVLRDGILAGLAGDTAALQAALDAAREKVGDLRDLLSTIDGPVRGQLDDLLSALEEALGGVIASALGVSVSLPPTSTSALPGTTVHGTVDVTNRGAEPLTDVRATVSLEGGGDASVRADEIAAGEIAQLPFSLRIPRHAQPGSYDATLSIELTRAGSTFTLTDAANGWVTVSEAVSLGVIASEVDDDRPAERATLTVPVINDGTASVTGQVSVDVPDGWSSVPSDEFTVAPGATVEVEVPVVVPLEVFDGPISIEVNFEQQGVTLASGQTELDLELPTPPVAETTDHLDWGDDTSEQAHALEAAPNSGTSVEAGLTRRYAHAGYPGSWFSATFDVPAGEPFILRNVDTYGGAGAKRYDVYVAGTLVDTVSFTHAENVAGTAVYDIVVDDPAVLEAGSDNVRIRFEFPSGSPGDPSLADTWVIPVPDDEQAPDISAGVVSGGLGDDRWYHSDVSVRVDAADNRDDAPAIQTGLDDGWQDYTGPVTVSGEGRHTLSFRATDAAGNRTTRSLPVRIDTTAPTTKLDVAVGADGDTADLNLQATDALSGVAETRYRIDGGDWAELDDASPSVSGAGVHTIEYASTDVAGNAEAVVPVSVTLVEGTGLQALVAPQISGDARLGSLLSSTTGVWNTTGLTVARQWLRDGTAIPGATQTTYTLQRADLATRISVRVTAWSADDGPVIAESSATPAVDKAGSTTSFEVGRTSVRAGHRVKVRVRVAADVQAGGIARIVLDGKTVRTVTVRQGEASTKVVVPRGLHKIRVRYVGSATVAASSSAVRWVRGRRD